jgi:hypothetical protein
MRILNLKYDCGSTHEDWLSQNDLRAITLGLVISKVILELHMKTGYLTNDHESTDKDISSLLIRVAYLIPFLIYLCFDRPNGSPYSMYNIAFLLLTFIKRATI